MSGSDGFFTGGPTYRSLNAEIHESIVQYVLGEVTRAPSAQCSRSNAPKIFDLAS